MFLSGVRSIDPDRGRSCPKPDTIPLGSPVSEVFKLFLSGQSIMINSDGAEVTSQGYGTD